MKINKKYLPYIGIAVLFSIIYILLATKPARNSLQFEPRWTIDITEEDVFATNSQVYPFKLGQYMGYYTGDGTISSLQILEEKGAISDYYMASFSSGVSQVEFFTSHGKKSGVLSSSGFPFFEENRIFLFSPSGNSFSAHASDGRKNWSYENYVPLTSFFSNDTGVAAGFADGKVVVFNTDGTIRQEFFPGGSEYEIIFGLAMSQSGQYIACLSGLERQRIVITDVKGNTSKIFFHEYVEKEVVEQSLVYFSENEKYVFVNSKNSMIIVDVEQKSTKTVPMQGSVVTIKEVYGGEYFFVLSKDRNESTVNVFNKHVYNVGSFSFEEKNTFLDSDNDHIYIGNDTKISKIFVH